jgi:hypothetical protein
VGTSCCAGFGIDSNEVSGLHSFTVSQTGFWGIGGRERRLPSSGVCVGVSASASASANVSASVSASVSVSVEIS